MILDRAAAYRRRPMTPRQAFLGLDLIRASIPPARPSRLRRKTNLILPDDHPVREALGPDRAEVLSRGVSRYRDVRSSDGKVFRRALLVCFPLINEHSVVRR